MPLPSDVYLSPVLMNLAIAYLQDQSKFIAPKLFPFVGVPKTSGNYFKFSFSDLNKIKTEKRAPGGKAAEVDWKTTTGTYDCQEYALRQKLPEEVRANDQVGLTDDQVMTQIITNWNLLKLEQLFISNFFAASKWTGSTTGSDIVPSTKWNVSSSTPIKDVKDQIRSVQKKTGYKPNKFAVTPDVDDALRNNADILGRLPVTVMQDPSNSDMAKLFGVDEYLVFEATYESAAENATSSPAFIAGTASALLVYASPVASKLAPSGGYIFRDDSFGPVDGQGMKFWKYWSQEIRSDWYEQAFKLDPKLIAADCGAFFATVMS